MKLLSQTLGLLLISSNALQLILTIGTAMVMLKLSADKLLTARTRWIVRKRKRAMESDMWAID